MNARGDLFTLCDGRIYVLRASSQWLEWYAGAPTAENAVGDRYACKFSANDQLEANDDCGLIWVSSEILHAIRVIIGTEVVPIAGRLGERGYRDGPSTFARFDSPTSIKRLFSQPSLLVAEANQLRLLDTRTHHVSTLKIDGTSSMSLLFGSWTAGYKPPQGTSERISTTSPADNSSKCIELATRQVEDAYCAPIGHFFPHSVLIMTNGRGTAYVDYNGREPTKSIETLLPDSNFKHIPIFIPHTNTVVGWSKEDGLLLKIDHYLEPPPPAPIIPRKLAKNWKRFLSEPIDFSSLIGSPIVGNTPFEFKNSRRVINLHSRVLKLNKGLQKKYKTILSALQTSDLPERSIEAFINYLYFKRISIDESTDIKSLSIEIGHVAWLCKEHGVEPSKVLFDLYSLVLPRITTEDLVECLIECWSSSLMQWKATDSFIALLASHLRHSPDGPNSFALAIADSNLPENSFDPLTSLFNVENAAFPISKIIDFAYINRGPKKLTREWKQTDDPSSLLKRPRDFAFGVTGSNKWIVLPAEYVWSQWSWFRHLVTSGLEESNTRIVRFQEPLTRIVRFQEPLEESLEILFSCLVRRDHWDINPEDAEDALAEAKELELVDEEGLPTSSFASCFVNSLLNSSFKETRVQNRMEQMEAYYELGFSHKFKDLLDHILMKDHPSDYLEILKEITPELLVKFQKHLASKKE